MAVTFTCAKRVPKIKIVGGNDFVFFGKKSTIRTTNKMKQNGMSGKIPPSEQYKVLRLVRREPVQESVCPSESSKAVHFSNASGSLRQVSEDEIRPLARESTTALISAVASGDDTAEI